MGAMLALAPALISGGSALANMFGGGGNTNASNVQLPNMFQMPGMNDAAAGAMSGTAGLSNQQHDLYSPAAQTVGQYYQGNPFQGQGMQNVQQASQAGMGVGQGAINAGNYLGGAGASMIPYMQPLMNAGMDPQQALYGRTQQQLQDQTRAGLESRGLDMSPYGAGVEGKVMSDFNIDWQNNQLQRMIQGAQGASGVLGAGGTAMQGGAGMAQQGYGTMSQAAMQPYQAYNQIGADNLNALSTLQGIGNNQAQVPQMQIQDYLSYLSAGNQAGGVANQTGQIGLNQAQLGFNQNQTLGANLGNSLAGVGNYFKNNPPTGWGGGSSGGQIGWPNSGGAGAYW